MTRLRRVLTIARQRVRIQRRAECDAMLSRIRLRYGHRAFVEPNGNGKPGPGEAEAWWAVGVPTCGYSTRWLSHAPTKRLALQRAVALA